MKYVFLMLLSVVFQAGVSQGVDSLWFTRSGKIYFISHTDIIDIDATNNQVGSFLNCKSGELAFTLLMKTFQFTLPLAEEHFNENYVESEKYPKSTFKGKILQFDPSRLVEGIEYPVEVEGDLMIHGVTARIKEKGTLKKSGGEIHANSDFSIALDTYKIKVPDIVKDRVAPVIPIKINMIYKPYSKGESK